MKRNALTSFLALAALYLAGSGASYAQSYWSYGHGDIGIELHGDHFHTHWGLDTESVVDGVELQGAEEFHPEEIVAWLNTTTNANSNVAGWLGVAEGSAVYRAGNNNYQPNLGFAAYGIGDNTAWENGGLTISFAGANSANPGDFALAFGNNLLFSTLNSAAPNSLFIGAGDHDHYTWLFSKAGYYELTFTWSGVHNEHGLVTISDTYGFQVGAIPEPSTWAMLLGGISAAGVVAVRRRQKARKN